MSKLEQLIAEFCPNGVPYKTLGEIGTITRGNGLQKSDFTENGVACIHYGQIYTYYGAFAYSTKSFVSPELAKQLKTVNKGDIIIAVTSENIEDVCKCVAWLGDYDIVTGGHTAILKHSQNPKYISYWLQTEDFFQQKRKIAHGIKVIEVTPVKLEDIRIPLPPLPVQREIVRILDKFSVLMAELIAKLQAELSARKKQYEYYRNELLTFGDDVPMVTLGEIGRVAMCKRIMKAETSFAGDVPFYKIGTFGKEPNAFISQKTYEHYKATYSYPQKGDVLISAAGTIGRAVIYDGEPAYYQDSNIVWLENDESKALNKYLFYIYQLKPWQVSTGGTIARIYNDNISKAKIPLPPLAEQARIVAILDRFDTLCTDLTSGLPAEIAARQQQYEYYRDKLLTFKDLRA